MSGIYDMSMTSIEGEPVSLGAFRDKVLLIVNVATY